MQQRDSAQNSCNSEPASAIHKGRCSYKRAAGPVHNPSMSMCVMKSQDEAQGIPLPPRARTFLESKWGNIIKIPDDWERYKALTELRKIPGMEHYEMKHLSRWVSVRLKVLQRKGVVDDVNERKSDSEAVFDWPSGALQFLRAALDKCPDPTPAKREEWAELLCLDLQQVRQWVDMQRTETKQPVKQVEDVYKSLPSPRRNLDGKDYVTSRVRAPMMATSLDSPGSEAGLEPASTPKPGQRGSSLFLRSSRSPSPLPYGVPEDVSFASPITSPLLVPESMSPPLTFGPMGPLLLPTTAITSDSISLLGSTVQSQDLSTIKREEEEPSLDILTPTHLLRTLAAQIASLADVSENSTTCVLSSDAERRLREQTRQLADFLTKVENGRFQRIGTAPSL